MRKRHENKLCTGKFEQETYTELTEANAMDLVCDGIAMSAGLVGARKLYFSINGNRYVYWATGAEPCLSYADFKTQLELLHRRPLTQEEDSDHRQRYAEYVESYELTHVVV